MHRVKSFAERLLRGLYFSIINIYLKVDRYVDQDGVTQSNSLQFQKYQGWRGLSVQYGY